MKIKRTLSLIVMMRKKKMIDRCPDEEAFIDRMIEILIEEINEDWWHFVADNIRIGNTIFNYREFKLEN